MFRFLTAEVVSKTGAQMRINYPANIVTLVSAGGEKVTLSYDKYQEIIKNIEQIEDRPPTLDDIEQYWNSFVLDSE